MIWQSGLMRVTRNHIPSGAQVRILVSSHPFLFYFFRWWDNSDCVFDPNTMHHAEVAFHRWNDRLMLTPSDWNWKSTSTFVVTPSFLCWSPSTQPYTSFHENAPSRIFVPSSSCCLPQTTPPFIQRTKGLNRNLILGDSVRDLFLNRLE